MTGDAASGSKKETDVIDFDDPYYIHPSDQAITSLISFKLLGSENYRVWLSSITRSLKGRNKLAFVDGTLPRASEDDVKIRKWDRANAIVCSWILNSVSETIYLAHATTEVAYVVWTELIETYHKTDGSVVFNLHQRINAFTQGSLSVSEYFSKLDSLWKEFDSLTSLTECTCTASKKFNDHANLMKLMQFLSCLDSSFSQAKSHILLMEPLPSVRAAFSIISREESHQKNGSSVTISNKTQTSGFTSKINEQKRGKIKNPKLQCKHCGLKGHTIERCFKIIGFPKDF